MRILLALVLTLIAYGSVFPFGYAEHAPSRADLAYLFMVWPHRLSLVDAAGNFLLFLPLGMCIAAMSARRRDRVVAIAAGIVFAWVLQYLQFWFPARDPTGSDAWFNSLGIVVGVGLGARAQALARAHRPRLADASALWPLATALLILWLAYRWFPLVPTLDPDNLRRALFPLHSGVAWSGARVLHDLAAWLLWLLLITHHSPWPGVTRGQAGAMAVAVLLVEPLFWHNVLTWSNVAGLLMALVLSPWLSRGPAASRRILVVLLASIVVSGLTPWPRAASPQEFTWMPFAGLLNGNMLGNTAALLDKSFLYGGAVLLLAQQGLKLPMAGALLALLLFGIEWAQRFSPMRTAELTDPLLALLFGVIFQVVLSARLGMREVPPAR
jgi:VanZ family protein